MIRRIGKPYRYRPLLLETLVDPQPFRGTCYRAANRTKVGQTAGRGRMDPRVRNHGQAIEEIHVYPLIRHAKERLCDEPAR